MFRAPKNGCPSTRDRILVQIAFFNGFWENRLNAVLAFRPTFVTPAAPTCHLVLFSLTLHFRSVFHVTRTCFSLLFALTLPFRSVYHDPKRRTCFCIPLRWLHELAFTLVIRLQCQKKNITQKIKKKWKISGGFARTGTVAVRATFRGP